MASSFPPRPPAVHLRVPRPTPRKSSPLFCSPVPSHVLDDGTPRVSLTWAVSTSASAYAPPESCLREPVGRNRSDDPTPRCTTDESSKARNNNNNNNRDELAHQDNARNTHKSHWGREFFAHCRFSCFSPRLFRGRATSRSLDTHTHGCVSCANSIRPGRRVDPPRVYGTPSRPSLSPRPRFVSLRLDAHKNSIPPAAALKTTCCRERVWCGRCSTHARTQPPARLPVNHPASETCGERAFVTLLARPVASAHHVRQERQGSFRLAVCVVIIRFSGVAR